MHHPRPGLSESRVRTQPKILERVLAEIDAAVDQLAGRVEVAEVAGGLLDHVHHDEAQVGDQRLVALAESSGGRRSRRQHAVRTFDLVAVEGLMP